MNRLGHHDQQKRDDARGERSAERAPGKGTRAPMVQRKSGGDDLAPDAAQQVERASSSSGAPLPATLQRKFEGSLGADLSGVRVHTGSESASAAESVSAKAYTVGSDIHFGAGHFDPSSRSGEELLAHEVAHTVQQSGSAQRKPQYKLEVSQPGDSSELEADSAASAMVNGQPAQVGGASGLSRKLHRYVLHTPGAGAGIRVGGTMDDSQVTISPRAVYWVNGRDAGHVDFSGDSQVQQLAVGANTQGLMQIYAGLHFDVDNSVPFSNAEYDSSFQVSWPVTVSQSGALTIADNQPIIFSADTMPQAQLSLGDVQCTKGDNYVDVAISIVTTTQMGRQMGGGPYSGSASAGGRTWTRHFRLNVIPPAVAPRGVVTMERPRIRRHHAILFDPGRDTLPAAEEQRLIQWYHGLSQETRDRIQSGAEPLDLTGHASTTGAGPDNRELSDRRRARVERIMRQFAGSQVSLHTRAAGEYEAQTGDGVEDARERRVDIEAWESFDIPAEQPES